MASVIYLDTHVVAWLFVGQTASLSNLAKELVDGHDLLISPIVLLELEFLREVGKTEVPPAKILETLGSDLGLKVCAKPFGDVVHESLRLRWTRDPFDRLITAHASLNQNWLLTRDEGIRRHYKHAVW